ncbi:MAG TPA: lysozyme [Salinimicrobium sp.]|nr:lysozyme [Salinimicrobium sp.]
MTVSNNLIEFVKQYESLHDGDLTKIGLQPKPCPAGYWTEGYGSVVIGPYGEMMIVEKYPSIEMVLPYSKITTEAEANADLISGLNKRAKGVNKRLKVNVSQCQFDALLSHAYNCGFSTTLYALVNSCAPEEKIKNWFTKKYITAAGKYMKGLQYRRNDEYEIWSGKNYKREYKLSV